MLQLMAFDLPSASPWASILSVALLVIGGVAIHHYTVTASHGPQEPPKAPSSLPIIGHVLGLMRSKFNYYVELSQQTSLPIFTMSLPGQKMYIVTSPDLIQKIQKQPKILSFAPIEAKFANRVCGTSAEAREILMKNVNGEHGDWGLSMESFEAMRAALNPGASLDDMNRLMIENIAMALDTLIPKGSKSAKVNLFQWARETVSMATTNSVYGKLNPFHKKTVLENFWQFEGDMMSLLIGFAPSIMARRGVQGRKVVAEAFEEYFNHGGHKEASVLVQNRYNAGARNGVSVSDISRYEVGGAVAMLANTAPAVFWMILIVCSYPDVLQEIREEVGAVTVRKTDVDGTRMSNSLDLTSLKKNCPLLASTFQEVLRYRSVGTSVRQVMEDTILAEQFLLKKGSMIQMPSRVIHSDPSIWGPDVDEFNPRRFMRETKKKNSKAAPAAAFRAFGGGTTLCPGRHFATNEILAMFVMLIMQYDIVPVNGQFALPTTKNTNVATVVMEPDVDIEVKVIRREGSEQQSWSFSLETSGDIFAVVVEDRAETDH